MSSKQLVVGTLVLAGALASGLAQARGGDDVQWSVTIGTPVGVPVVRQAYPVYTQPVQVVPVQRYPRHAYQQPTRWDRDGDGIPNRYDRVYNPRWDLDGDGIPNRQDRAHNPRWDRDGDGVPNRYDHRDGSRHDRDGDGVPNWQDRNDGFGQRGGR